MTDSHSAKATAGLALPFASTVSSYDSVGAAWQGRYGLPLAMGIVLLAAYALDRSGRDLRPQAGIVVHERAPDGQLAAVRVYDDIEPPVEYLR